MNHVQRRLRTEVYAHFAETTRPPSDAELAAALEASEATVREGLRALARDHHLVLDAATGAIRMAHPFSGVPTAFPVDTPRGLFWANCAWDALGIPALLSVDGRTRTACPVSGRRLELEVRDGALLQGDGVIHFAVAPRHFWEDIGFT